MSERAMAAIPAADARIAVIGLGYVGLPLAVEFAEKLQAACSVRRCREFPRADFKHRSVAKPHKAHRAIVRSQIK